MTIAFFLVIIPLFLMGYFYKMLLPDNEYLNKGWVKFVYCLIAPLVASVFAFALMYLLIDVLGITFGVTAGRIFMGIISWTVVSYIFVYFTIRVREE